MKKLNFKAIVPSVFLVFLVLFASIFTTGCNTSSNINEPNKKIKIMASLFPQYDFARQIVKDKAEVSLLLPPGAESHTFDPSPSDILKISNSDIFLYTGNYMEPWAQKIINAIDSKKTTVIDVSSGINLFESEHEEDEDHEDCDDEECDHEHHHSHEYDPHIWLDPTLAIAMVDNITNAVCQKDPQNKDFYIENSNEYKAKLQALDKDFETMINNSQKNKVIFAGRFAHLYFIKRYNLEYMSAFDGCSAEAEPGVKRLTDIINTIKQDNIHYIYYEEITQPKIATSIAEQTNTQALKFSTVHNITKDQLNSNISYIDIMYENLENLKKGLN